MKVARSIFYCLFVSLLWLRAATWLDRLTHDAKVALLLCGTLAWFAFLALRQAMKLLSRHSRRANVLRRLRGFSEQAAALRRLRAACERG
ncbi:MAG: hypothetical protein ABSD98_00640 [Candidatus Korobacteraceae bacterium]|jgi:hypothetical protein